MGSMASVLISVRSMPVATCVPWVAVLLVSSASKMALLGSTVTVLVMEPTKGGATSTIVIMVVDSGPTTPPVQVGMLVAGSTAQPAKAGATKLSKIVPAGSGSRTTTPVAVWIPLLPTTKV